MSRDAHWSDKTKRKYKEVIIMKGYAEREGGEMGIMLMEGSHGIGDEVLFF